MTPSLYLLDTRSVAGRRADDPTWDKHLREALEARKWGPHQNERREGGR